MAKAIPEGMTSVTPHLIVAGAADAIEFYKKAFGAEEVARLPGPDGKIMHAAIKIGGDTVMLVDEMPQWGALGLRENMRTPLELVRLMGAAPEPISLKGGEWIPILCSTGSESATQRLGVAYVGKQRRIERVLMHAPLKSGSVALRRVGESPTKSEAVRIERDNSIPGKSGSDLYVYTTAEEDNNAAWKQPGRQRAHSVGAGMKDST